MSNLLITNIIALETQYYTNRVKDTIKNDYLNPLLKKLKYIIVFVATCI